MKDYSKFDIEDFATDEYFVKWVKVPDDATIRFWTAWISKHPYQKEIIRKARQIVLALDVKENIYEKHRFIEGWANISRHIHRHELELARTVKRGRKRWVYNMAASISLLVILSAYAYYHVTRPVRITTAYGESTTFFLPDSSKVTLNANSSIEYKPYRFNSSRREIYLDGEGFFSVVHKTNNEKFLVHTTALAVEVLGTKFNVSSRRGASRVVLQEGKVRISTPDDSTVMKPGDLVDVSTFAKGIVKKSVNPDDYTSWKSNRLTFLRVSLGEIAMLLEDNFGYSVKFEDRKIKDNMFTGSASSEDIDGLLNTLSKVFEIKIEQRGKDLFISDIR